MARNRRVGQRHHQAGLKPRVGTPERLENLRQVLDTRSDATYDAPANASGAAIGEEASRSSTAIGRNTLDTQKKA